MYARATSLNVLPSRIRMKLDWPGLELITDAKTTPASGKEEVVVGVQSRISNVLLLQNTVNIQSILWF